MLAKAASLAADQVFLDLEDSVAAAEKTDATRQQVVEALNGNQWVAATKVVRVNGVRTPWCYQDMIRVIEGAGNRVDCVMIPKVECSGDVEFVDRLLGQLEAQLELERPIGLEVQIESPLGLSNIYDIARASTRIEALIFGPGDYAASAGMPQLTVGATDPGYPGDQWHYVLSQILTAARASGLQAIDGPYAAIHDHAGFAEVARRSRLLGFDGKWALHPGQIALCNEIYSPSQAEFVRATEILAAYSQATDSDRLGAVMLGSEMIDEASRKMAEQVVRRGQAAGLTGP
jgi:citrate lyase subunit beta/citryl-CoA lyase